MKNYLDMQIIQWSLVAIMIVIGVVGGYYQLQIIAYLKIGKGGSALTGGWIFHPEYIEKEGQRYRKKLFACWVIFLLLVMVMKVLTAHQLA